ncbi:hypothetical protein [Salinibacter ruber]|uniref:hypothetical protein n=1 Tax=Salinibacter ruber TaxID=146919 RepID=UPI002166F536|nr:hypothetical protein [Salinibacter ruber]MCS4044881.1 hypothetical protein [Salinibacter ruber]MCS4149508.1 hypothetical protein [Salinibacter ruber]
MDFRFIVRRTGLLLFAGLFGFATLQPATAQNSHEVTVNVEPIQKLSIKNDVGPVTVSELSEPEDGIGNSDFIANSEGQSTTGTFDIVTNLTGQRVEAKVIKDGSQGQIGELGLQVSLTGLNGGETVQGYQTLLLPSDVDRDPGTKTVAKNIGHTDTDGTLTYRAIATPEFDPTSDATVKVEYTLTGQ